MTQSKYSRPNRTNSTATYTSNIDNGFEVFERGAGSLFQCHAQDTPDMTVRLEAGVLFDGPGNAPTEVAAQNSGTITAPTSNSRIDRVVIGVTAGAVSIITGTSATAPAAPAVTSGKITIAYITIDSTSTSITNAMIEDERPSWFGNVTSGGGLTSVAADTTPQLGGDLDVNGNEIQSVSGGDITIHSDNEIIMLLGDTAGSDTVSIRDSSNSVVASVNSDGDIACTDITANSIVFGSGVSASAILDEDTLSSDSNTALATQQSIKAYVDSASGGDFTKISTTTLSTSASSVDFTGLSGTYEEYYIVLANVVPSTDTDNLWVRTSTDNGSSFDSTASAYSFAGYGANSAGFLVYDAADSEIEVTTNGVGNAANEVLNGVLHVFAHNDTEYTTVQYEVSYVNGSAVLNYQGATGQRIDTTAVDAVRILFSTGNIKSGTFTLYGVAS